MQRCLRALLQTGPHPGLSKLVLMVREDQVTSTPMDVNDVTHELPDHCTALYVPAWPSLAPRAGPCGLSWLGCLPESKISWTPLAIINSNTLTGTIILLRTGSSTAAVVFSASSSSSVSVRGCGSGSHWLNGRSMDTCTVRRAPEPGQTDDHNLAEMQPQSTRPHPAVHTHGRAQ